MAQNLSGNDLQGWDGWIWIGAGSRVSGTSLTISGDYTAIISPGDRLKLTDTTTKYFYVLAPVTFSAGVTTLTVTGGSDYSLVGTPSAISYSKMASPTSFPQWFNYTPTFAGWSTSPTYISRFNVTGRLCTVVLNYNGGTATSNATTMTGTLPIAVGASAGAMFAPSNGQDGSANLANPARASISPGSTTITWTKDWAGAAWTASGTKVVNANFTYEF